MFIPSHLKQSEKSYALGKYIIHPSHTNNIQLEKWIKDIQFEQCETSDNRMQLHSRKRNNLYSFYLDAIDKQVVLKVSQISKHYRWYRKLNLVLVNLFKNYSLNAYYGGIALEKINVKSLNVIAHWKCKRQAQSEKSYLLYEQIPANMSVFDLCVQLSEKNQQANKIIQLIAQSLALIIKKLHENDIRHGDPHAGNFLVTSELTEIAQITPELVSNMKFALIDLDKVHYSDKENYWLKKIYNIRCIRRFYVHNLDSRQCLEYYLGRKPKISEKLILSFWLKGGFNFYKWIKRSNKRN